MNIINENIEAYILSEKGRSYGIEHSLLRPNFEPGDDVITELYSIDEDTYIYYSELNDGSGGLMGGSSTPYNPKSNFGSEVMGYFSAWSKVKYNAVVE